MSAARYAQLLVPMWLGMVVAISFLEAPIKFRAPGVTLPVGLGIGRLVFKALNGVEIALLLLLGVSCYVVTPAPLALILLVSVAVVLVIRVVVVRAPLSKRTDRVLAGAIVPRSRNALDLHRVGAGQGGPADCGGLHPHRWDARVQTVVAERDRMDLASAPML